MKVLQINCVYKSGSTGKIVHDIHTGLVGKGHKSVVCYGRGREIGEDGIYKVSSEIEAKVHSVLGRLFGVMFGFSPIATARTIGIIKKEKPDVVHLHCLNGNFINVYRLLNFLKKAKIKTVLTLHAEIMHTAGCEHAMDCEKWKTECNNCAKVRGKISRFFRDDAKYCYNKMKRAFSGFENLTVVGVSEWLTERGKMSSVFPEVKFNTVHNGIDTETFFYTEHKELREKLNIPKDKKIILHVTPNFNHPIKGGKYVLELAEKMPEHQFIIVGFNGDKNVLPGNVMPISHTKDKNELAKIYSMADVTLLTSKRETFSMVLAESLCCGTPVAGFEAGAPETITIPEYSAFVKQGDIEALTKAVSEMAGANFDCEKISKNAIDKYDKKTMAGNYISCYEQV